MGVPLVRRFDLSLSGRYDHFDDVGGTTNPKIAANWDVIPGLRLRGNYATAFVAPPLASIGFPELGGSEERRVGKECVSTCRSRWAPYHEKKNRKTIHKRKQQHKH